MVNVLTLLYHRVREFNNDIQLLSVTPENFCDQIEWISDNYKVVSFDDNWNALDDGNYVCITFDDGYEDNFEIAIPILNRYATPACIFVSTGNLNTDKELWWDELERNLLVEKEYRTFFELEDAFWKCRWNTSSYERRLDMYYSLHWIMKNYISVATRDKWLGQLQKWNDYNNIGRTENRVVQSHNIQKYNLERICIGAHTQNHPKLSSMSLDEQQLEIINSKTELEKIFHRSITTFSYPFGTKSDYDGNSIDICTRTFAKSAANIPGIWRSGDEEFEVPRNIVRNWNKDEFSRMISAMWEETI